MNGQHEFRLTDDALRNDGIAMAIRFMACKNCGARMNSPEGQQTCTGRKKEAA